MTVTHFDVFPARSTDRTQSFFALVLTFTECDFDLGLDALMAVTAPPEDFFTSMDPIPLLESDAATFSVTPFLPANARNDCTEADESGTLAADAVAELVTGAVVSRMMSSDCASDWFPKRVTNFT